jgi:hypothetical protein
VCARGALDETNGLLARIDHEQPARVLRGQLGRLLYDND